jgi:hypothetical protein
MRRSFQDELLARAYKESDEGRPLAAVDLVVERLDAWLTAAEFERVRWLLEHLEGPVPREMAGPGAPRAVGRGGRRSASLLRRLEAWRGSGTATARWRRGGGYTPRVNERLRGRRVVAPRECRGVDRARGAGSYGATSR